MHSLATWTGCGRDLLPGILVVAFELFQLAFLGKDIHTSL